MRRFSAFLVFALILILILSGCGKKETLKMGTEATFAPFEFTNEENEVIGFDIDIANEIAKSMKKELEIVNMDFDSLTAAVQANQIDMAVAGMTITKERLKNVDFSIPYYDASQVIVVQEDNDTISKRDDLSGKIIAVQMGTTGADSALEIENANVKQFGKVNEAFLELKNGRADAVIIDAPVAKNYLKNLSGLKIASEPFTEEQYAIAVKKGNTELLNDINQVLTELMESGKYDDLYNKWFKED